jgi:ATP-binding cassette subfamily C protein CydD
LYIVLSAAFGATTAGLVVAQALLIAWILGPLADGTATVAQLVPRLVGIAGVGLARAILAAAQERYSHRAATDVIADLRGSILDHAVALGPRWRDEGHAAEVASLVTRGLDGLNAYFSRYLPQFLMVATVTPALLVVVWAMDWVSGIIILVTLPLVPVFMILIGKTTQEVSERRLTAMTTLGSRVLDLLAGLPTLKALGREAGPASRVRELSAAHARTTFGTVRVAFLSSAALELVSTLSVAVVAVQIGLRLVAHQMPLTPALAILVMAPEVYKPLRAVGTHFHASASGLAAADRAFAILQTPLPVRGDAPAPDLSRSTIRVEDVGVRPPGRDLYTPANLTLTLRPGTVTALVGPNGVGKSTAVEVLLGLIRPDHGRVVAVDDAGSQDLSGIDPHSWWAQIAWMAQRPCLVNATVWQNLSGDFSGPPVPDAVQRPRAEAAALQASLSEILAQLPDGWRTVIGEGGAGLSLGQRQRLALARVIFEDKPVVILDEPAAHLDEAAAGVVRDAIGAMARGGRTVLVVTHRPDLIAMADHSVTAASAPAPPREAQVAP